MPHLSAKSSTTKPASKPSSPRRRVNPNVDKITGVICGYRVEDLENPLMGEIRYLGK